MDKECFVFRKSRIDYIVPVVALIDREYGFAYMPKWINGGHGYCWDSWLCDLTGCLDSELL